MTITDTQLNEALKGWDHPALAVLELPTIDYLDTSPKRGKTRAILLRDAPPHQIERLQFYRWLYQKGRIQS